MEPGKEREQEKPAAKAPEAVAAGAQAYLDRCRAEESMPSLPGLALHLGVEEGELDRWRAGKGAEDRARGHWVRQVELHQHDWLLRRATGAEKGQQIYLGLLKALHGYDDKKGAPPVVVNSAQSAPVDWGI